MYEVVASLVYPQFLHTASSIQQMIELLLVGFIQWTSMACSPWYDRNAMRAVWRKTVMP